MSRTVLPFELEEVPEKKLEKERLIFEFCKPFNEHEKKILELLPLKIGKYITAQEIKELSEISQNSVYRREVYGPTRPFKKGNRKVFESWFIIILLRQSINKTTAEDVAIKLKKYKNK